MFGVKTRISNSLFEGWVDTEFLEFGKNVVVGQGAIVMSSMIIGNLLIIKKTLIDDEVRILQGLQRLLRALRRFSEKDQARAA